MKKEKINQNAYEANEVHVCDICGGQYVGFGNNAWPVKYGRCCDKCNSEKVIPARLKQAFVK